MEKWKKILKYPLIWLFALFIFGFALWDILTPSREFSEMENRMLQQNPPFSLKSLMAKGEQAYTRKYEKYINDQFVLRDGWITLKFYGESALGKIENNNVAFGKDGYLFEKVFSVDEENLSANLKYMEEFLDKYPDLPVTFSVIPNAYTVLTEKLPAGFAAVSVDQNQRIGELYSRLEGKSSHLKLLELSPVLLEHQEEYIYYRTDHHWTTYGAYLAYGEYVRSLGLEPVPWGELEPHEVEGFYGSFDAKAKKAGTLPDVITWFDIPCRVEVNQQPVDFLHDLSRFEMRDKYSGLMHGNQALTVLYSQCNQNQQEGKTSRVLVVKDSYGNSFAPYLCYNFDEVYVIDLRYLGKMSAVLTDMGLEFDDVLILYNFMNFTTDTNIPKLRY